MPLSKLNLRDRLKASGIHLCISLVFAALAALLVFGLWYPYPYREISGGRELFLLVVSVDVVLGPLITLAIFNRSKPMKELRRDLALVGLIQLAALGYGLWTVSVARPVHLVFEYNRFRVIHAVDVPDELLDKAPPALRSLPLLGPTPISLRPFKDANEMADATLVALRGISLSARPDLWQDYAPATVEILRIATPVAQLKARFPARAAEIDQTLAAAGRANAPLLSVPMIGRKTFWTVFVDPITAQPLAFMPLDSF